MNKVPETVQDIARYLDQQVFYQYPMKCKRKKQQYSGYVQFCFFTVGANQNKVIVPSSVRKYLPSVDMKD